MDSLDKVRARQKTESDKKEKVSEKKARSKAPEDAKEPAKKRRPADASSPKKRRPPEKSGERSASSDKERKRRPRPESEKTKAPSSAGDALKSSSDTPKKGEEKRRPKRDESGKKRPEADKSPKGKRPPEDRKPGKSKDGKTLKDSEKAKRSPKGSKERKVNPHIDPKRPSRKKMAEDAAQVAAEIEASKSEKQILKENKKAEKQSKKAHKKDARKQRRMLKKEKKRNRHPLVKILIFLLKLSILAIIGCVIGVGMWIHSMIDMSFGDDLSSMNLNISSVIYYTDEDGNSVEYAQFDASENRIWIPINEMPENLKNAFVAIEDQRFYQHKGFDVKRTTGAVISYLSTGDSSYGGSTITQQLVKNITADRERTSVRKVREILRACVLETKLSKEQILELYLNTIYLSQGANGVESAAQTYFSKEAKELTLGECACIAGITQYPTKFDPILHPQANEEKRMLVLEKMLELDYITQAQYDQAVAEKMNFKPKDVTKRKIQSYFLDHLFEEVRDDLVKKGYKAHFAENMIYNGGLKIHCTIDPTVQDKLEDYFENDENFPRLYGDVQPQCAMVISDPSTGEVKGIIGGRGSKELNRSLNRATQTTRQPGSSIKPIAVYAPALDQGVITTASSVDDSPLNIDGWKPKNAGGGFHGVVGVRTAVAYSYNIPAVRVLESLSVEKSYDYMINKLHMDTLVEARPNGEYTLTDKNLPALALGGLTDGVTVLDMNGAYGALANNGVYIEPHTYTKIYDVEGRVLLEKKPQKNRAFSAGTAYLMSDMLKAVVNYGTAGGSKIPNIDTCGKTGTTDSNKDRWFVGYTPYYVASVWFGYDIPRPISAGGNPALNVWKDIMFDLHKDLPERSFEVPDTVKTMTVCARTGKTPSAYCQRVTQLADTELAKETCSGQHKALGTPAYKSSEEANAEKDKDKDKKEEEQTQAPQDPGPGQAPAPDPDTGDGPKRPTINTGGDGPEITVPEPPTSDSGNTGATDPGPSQAPPAPEPSAPSVPSAPQAPSAPETVPAT